MWAVRTWERSRRNKNDYRNDKFWRNTKGRETDENIVSGLKSTNVSIQHKEMELKKVEEN